MPSTKELRRRIKSIKSTRQITKAMEMVSAAKMRRAQMQALASRTYAGLAWELVSNLASQTHPDLHRLLKVPEKIENVGVVLLTSNRGLIGGFNNNLINIALGVAANTKVEYITLGKKGREGIRKRGAMIAAEFEKKDITGSIADITPIAKLLVEDFVSGKYDRVAVVYMHFVSTLQQTVKVLDLLPLAKPRYSLSTINPSAPVGHLPSTGEINKEYLFEPSADVVLESFLPRLVEMQVYQALLESNASEHSARMVAMKNASDAAGDLVDELSLEYNQLRQAAITKEISEIVAGRLAIGG